MPVLESQARGRASDRTPLFYADSAHGVPPHPDVAQYVKAFDRRRVNGQIVHSIPSPARAAIAAPDAPASAERRDGAQAALIRGFDIIVAAVAIVMLMPLMILVACLIKISNPGPAIFRQQRVGRDGVLFPCLKFRSMVTDAQERLDKLLLESETAREEWARDQKLRNDPRITPLGEFLRKTSLDELPQLFTILAGQMSVVGPRPIVENEIARYGMRFDDYCSVRPGLTGLWQISGRNDVSYGMRVRLDSLYAQRQSLALNFAICIKTVPAILTSRGCY